MDVEEKTVGALVTSAEAARLLGMSVRGFLRAARRSKTLHKHPESGRFRFFFSRAKVLAWAEEDGEGKEGEA